MSQYRQPSDELHVPGDVFDYASRSKGLSAMALPLWVRSVRRQLTGEAVSVRFAVDGRGQGITGEAARMHGRVPFASLP